MEIENTVVQRAPIIGHLWIKKIYKGDFFLDSPERSLKNKDTY